MRKLISVALAVILLLGLSVSAFAGSDVKVAIDGEYVRWSDAAPFIDKNGRTMVPLRPIAEALGIEVGWDGKAKEAYFYLDNFDTMEEDGIGFYEEIRFTIGSKIAVTTVALTDTTGDSILSSTENVVMDTEPVIVGGRTYAPVRYLAEFFEVLVEWDRSTKTVLLDTSYYETDYFIFKGLVREDDTPDYFEIQLCKGDLTPKNLRITEVFINDMSISFSEYPASDISLFNSVTGSNVIYAIKVPYALKRGVDYEVDFTVSYTDADGFATDDYIWENYSY